MNKSNVIEYFGDIRRTADALGISYQAVYKWPDLVPRSSAYQIQVVTRGKLKVDPSVYAHHAKH